MHRLAGHPRAVICPPEWCGVLSDSSSTGLLINPISRPELHTLESATQGVAERLRDSGLLDDVDTAVLVLPSEYAQSRFSPLWPQPALRWVEGGVDRIVLLSTVFADCPASCLQALALEAPQQGLLPWNVTAQYAPAYIETLHAWQAAGARVFHPGDYFKAELLEAMDNWRGHWIYLGHAEVDRLRGYEHVFASDLQSISRAGLLESTLWLSCNTLAYKPGIQALGLTWYLSGASRLFIGAVAPTSTSDNQHFCRLCLQGLLHTEASKKASNTTHTFSDVLRWVFSNLECPSTQSSTTKLSQFNQHYRILGNPWVRV